MNDIRGGVLSPWLQRRRLEMGPRYLRGRVLDYGCSDGQLAASCRPKAYLGVDVNLRALDQARAAHPGFRFATSVSDQERFDTVAAFAFIEHVADPGAWLARFASLLAPGGRIVLTTPHPSWEWAHTLGARTHLFSWDAPRGARGAARPEAPAGARQRRRAAGRDLPAVPVRRQPARRPSPRRPAQRLQGGLSLGQALPER